MVSYTVKAIVAISSNGYIGKEGRMPWHSKEEFKHFKRTTNGQIVVMGRKTYESIGKPLKNRVNIVFSSTKVNHPDVLTVHSKEQFDNLVNLLIRTRELDQDIFIIGGNQLFKLFDGQIEEFIVSRMKLEVDGDTKLEYSLDNFVITDTMKHKEFEVEVHKPSQSSLPPKPNHGQR